MREGWRFDYQMLQRLDQQQAEEELLSSSDDSDKENVLKRRQTLVSQKDKLWQKLQRDEQQLQTLEASVGSLLSRSAELHARIRDDEQ